MSNVQLLLKLLTRWEATVDPNRRDRSQCTIQQCPPDEFRALGQNPRTNLRRLHSSPIRFGP